MRDLLFIDFETLYDTKSNYTLKKLSIREYILHPRFRIYGAAVALNKAKPVWLSGDDLLNYFKTVDWKNTATVIHNSKFDSAVLAWKLGHIPGQFICTQSMSRAVNGYTVPSHALGKLAERFGLPEKGIMQTDGKNDLSTEEEKALAEYCERDIYISQLLYYDLEPKFPKSEYTVLDWTIRTFVQPKLQLNTNLLEELHEKEKQRRDAVISAAGVHKSVFASNDQFAALLKQRGYEVPLKTSPKRRNEDGSAFKIPALALGDEEFQAMLNSGNEELETLCEARVAAKGNLIETRSKKFIEISKLGAFPFDVQYSGAQQTHRFAGGSGGGGNPQNIQRCKDKKGHKLGHYCKGQLRQAVEAPAGHKLVVGDWAAIEARIVAWSAHDPILTKAFSNGEDVYCGFGSIVYKRTITKEDEAERNFSKEGVLGLGYGMGAAKFKKRVKLILGIDISEEEAQKTVDLYRETYTVSTLWGELSGSIQLLLEGGTYCLPGIPFILVREGALVLPSGLRLQFPGLYSEEKPSWNGRIRKEWQYKPYRKGHMGTHKLYGGKLLENISQALAGEICKTAIVRCLEAGLDVVGQVHDELIVVAKEAEAQTVAETLRQIMEQPMPWLPALKLTAEVKIGRNWAEAK